MRKITDKMVQQAIKAGWSKEDAKRGYAVCVSDYGNGAHHIEKIDMMDVFSSDSEAADQAEKDGIKIIHDLNLPEEHAASYIDTPENRKLLYNLIVQ